MLVACRVTGRRIVSLVSSAHLVLFLIAAALIVLPLSAAAFKEGPYPNVTGGFGEQSCRVCHLDNPLNAPGGRLDIEGVPPTYTGGERYRITVSIARDGLRRGGFEIAARFASGKDRGKQAGVWKAIDDRVQLIPGATDPALTFVQHNLVGSRAPDRGVNRWTVEWTAPAAALPVQFNVAANASNNDDSPLGDFIYVRTVRSAPAPTRPREHAGGASSPETRRRRSEARMRR